MAGAVEGGRKAKGNGWPTFSFSEGWEAKDDGTVSCSYTCVKEISLLPLLSFAEVELQLEAGTGFLRKEEKLGNVY